MSAKHYYKLWMSTLQDTQRVVFMEKQVQKLTSRNDPLVVHSILGNLFAYYVMVVNNLNDIYDQTLQVQKRGFLQKLLDSVTTRLLEIKQKLHEIELNDIIYVDHTLISNQITPQQIQLSRPYYFLHSRTQEIQDIINEYRENKANRENDSILTVQSKLIKMEEQFVDPIVENNSVHQEQSTSIRITIARTSDELIQRKEHAAKTIQKLWFRYKARRDSLKKQYDDACLLGLAEYYDRNKIVIEAINNAKEMKRIKKSEFNRKFESVCEEEKEKIFKKNADRIKFDVSDYIRNWFKEMYDMTDEFDVYPPESKGGSIPIIMGETRTPEDFRDFLNSKKSTKTKNATKTTAKPRVDEQKKVRNPNQMVWNFDGPDFITKSFINIEELLKEYNRDWIFINEAQNTSEVPFRELIHIDKFAEMHQEMHKEVDKSMRIEYEKLQMARCADLKKKYKSPKIKKGKKKRTKGKKKKQVDITADRSVQSLFDELIEMDIVLDYPKCSLDDYMCDSNYVAYELRNYRFENPPVCMAEIKNALRFAALGMGPLNLTKPKSICLSGPSGFGKKFLIHAIANELDAVILNLDPDIVVRFKEDMKYFIHLITKMAKILQPTILFIDGAHKPFIKKAQIPEKKADYQLLGKYLPKILKEIKKVDKVMLIATTNEPWNSITSKMRKNYELILPCPIANYSDNYMVWRRGILDRLGYDIQLNISPLVKATLNYSPASILSAIDQVFSCHQMEMFKEDNSILKELLNELLNSDYAATEETDAKKYRNWYMSASKLARRRNQYTKAMQDVLKRKK